MKTDIRVMIDGFNLNASFYGAMTREDAIKHMKADDKADESKAHLNDEWYDKAYTKLSEALDKGAEKESVQAEKEVKANNKTMNEAAKAAEKNTSAGPALP